MSSPLFRLGQVLRGKRGTYTIAKEIQETVWLATNQVDQTTVVKSVRGHFRVENERDVLKRFQGRSPYIRPLIDEIVEPAEPPTIVLKYLEDDLMSASKKRTLTRKELKYVAKCVLEALAVLHEDGYVHTDVKPDNVFVNCRDNAVRFAEVELGDCGSTYHVDSDYAKEGAPIGAPIWRSPEALLMLPWSCSTDIWSFGAMIITLIYGGDFNLFKPKDVKFGHEEYELKILMRQFQYFGPFPAKYEEIADPETVQVILYLMEQIPQHKLTSFHRTTPKEVSKEDNAFICKIMKLDPRDRPSAKELLQDQWFSKDQ